MSAGSPIDWNAVRVAYESGQDTVRSVADRFAVAVHAINYRAKKNNWRRRRGKSEKTDTDPQRVLVQRLYRTIDRKLEQLEARMQNNNDDFGETAPEGREAVESLEKLLEAVEKGDLWGFSDKQAAAMVRVAKVLIAAIDKETTVWESLVKSGSLLRLKKAMEKLIEKISEDKPVAYDEPLIWEKETLEASTRRCDK